MISKLTCALLSSVLVAGAAFAQDKPENPAASARPPRKVPTPLRLQVIYSRFQGEKKLSSVPYTLSINADDRPTQLRMGIEVPIQVGTKAGEAQFNYRSIGTNLDCGAESEPDGRYKLNCTFEQSSVYSTSGERGSSGSVVGDVPVANTPFFRTFKSSTNLMLRDGQSTQYTAATDPVSGEVLKIDVTLTVVK